MNNPIKDVFVSYSHKDKFFVRKLVDRLESFGISVWLDEGEILPGDRIREKINQGILSSKYLIVVVSENSIDSPWVKTELDSGMMIELENNDVVVLPVLFGVIGVSDIPIDLRGKLYVDFRNRNNFTKVADHLAGSIIKRIGVQQSISISDISYTIDLLKADGSEVLYVKKKKFCVLSQTLEFIQEEYFADGTIEFLRVFPGEILGKEYTLNKHVLTLGFGKVLRRGDKFEQTIEAIYRDSFTGEREYWETEHVHPASRSEYKFIFPIDRPYKLFKVAVKRGVNETKCNVLAEEFKENDRTGFYFVWNEAPLYQKLRIYWEW